MGGPICLLLLMVSSQFLTLTNKIIYTFQNATVIWFHLINHWFHKPSSKFCSCRCEIRLWNLRHQLSQRCPGPSFHHGIIAGPTSSRNGVPSKFKIHKIHTGNTKLPRYHCWGYYQKVDSQIYFKLLFQFCFIQIQISKSSTIRDQLFIHDSNPRRPREVRQKLSIKFKSGRTSWRRTRRKTTQASNLIPRPAMIPFLSFDSFSFLGRLVGH